MATWTAGQLRKIDAVRDERNQLDRRLLNAKEENTRLRYALREILLTTTIGGARLIAQGALKEPR